MEIYYNIKCIRNGNIKMHQNTEYENVKNKEYKWNKYSNEVRNSYGQSICMLIKCL